MTTFKIEPKHVEGISVGVPSSVKFLSNNDVIYPCGGVLTIHNLLNSTQKFINVKKGPKKIINWIIIHPKRKSLALSCTEPKPIIEIYDLASRTLVTSIPVDAAVITMCYSCNGGHLFYITQQRNPTMYCYCFLKNKVESSIPATEPPAYSGPVKKIRGNITDAMHVAIVGTGLFRLLKNSDFVWKQYGFKKADLYNFVSLCWISAERLVAGTSAGRIILVESGELKSVYKAYDTDVIMLASNRDQLLAMIKANSPAVKDSTKKEVFSIIRYGYGFAFIISPNIVVTFEKESNTKYAKRREFLACGDQIGNVAHKELDRIFSISISPDSKRILCCTHRAQIYSASLSDGRTSEDKVPFTPLIGNLHYGEVRALAMCPWRSFVMTSGLIDRRICLYQYEKNKLLFSQVFDSDIHGLTMHPTGLLCIISFSDFTCICYLMKDRLEFGLKISSNEPSEDYSPLQCCRVMDFSLYGSLLAVADGVQIKLYDYIQFHLLFTLLGHRQEITSFKWMPKDNVLLSCGLDGAVYKWDTNYGRKILGKEIQNCQHHDIEATSDGNLIYTVGEDGHIKEMKNQDIIRDLAVSNCSLSHIVMSKNNQIVVVSNERGIVMVVNYPFVEKVNFEKYCLHTTAVTQMKLTYENTLLITSDKDGMICFWKITNADGIELLPSIDLFRCPDIFISNYELGNKRQTLKDLEEQINEFKVEHKIKVKEMHTSHADEIKKLKIENKNYILRLNQKITKMKEENVKQVASLKFEQTVMHEIFEKELDLIEKHLKYNLNVRENERKDKVQFMIKKVLKSRKEKILPIEKKYKQELSALRSSKTKEFSVLYKQFKNLEEKVRNELDNQDRMKELVEDDADRAILEIQRMYEALIQEETKKYTNLKQKEGVCKEEIKAMEEEIKKAKLIKAKLEETIQNLEKENTNSESRIEELLGEILEMDKFLIPKERNVHFLKLRAENLKKHIDLLNMRTAEIEKAKKPKDEIIAELDSKIDAFKQELFEKEQEIKNLQLLTKHLREGVQTTKKEHERNKERKKELRSLLNMMHNDIYDVYQTVKDLSGVQLKSATVKLYNKYVREKTVDILLKELRRVGVKSIHHHFQLININKALNRQLARKKNARTVDMRIRENHAQSYYFNNLLRKHYIADADKLGRFEKQIRATDKQISIRLDRDNKMIEDKTEKMDALLESDSKPCAGDLKFLQKPSSIKNKMEEKADAFEQPILVLRDELYEKAEHNRKVHAECRNTIKELEEKKRKLNKEVVQVQKEIFHQERQNFDRTVPFTECPNKVLSTFKTKRVKIDPKISTRIFK